MMEVVLAVIVVALISAAIEHQLEAKAKAAAQVRALEDERKKAREDLVRFGATDLVAYGARYGLVTGPEMSDEALIRAETQKWTILNGGLQLAKILVKGGTVAINYDEAGVPTLKLERANLLLSLYDKDFDPFVLSDFRTYLINPGVAAVSFLADRSATAGLTSTRARKPDSESWP